MLSFSALLTSVTTQLSSFSRLSKQVQIFFQKKTRSAVTLISKCVHTLYTNVYPFLRHQGQRSIPRTGGSISNTKQASPSRSNVRMYMQFVYLHKLPGNGNRGEHCSKLRLCQNFQLCQTPLPASCPSGLPCVKHDDKLGAEGRGILQAELPKDAVRDAQVAQVEARRGHHAGVHG